MPEFDHGAKIIARTTGRPLARLAGLRCQRLDPLESTLQTTTELLADRVFLARQGQERFVVYFEFCTVWKPEVPWDLLAKAGLLSQREHLPTVCIPVILQRRRYRATGGTLRLAAAGTPTQQLWYKEVRLWEQTPESWWEEQPGLMALYPLCQHGRPPGEAIQHATAVIERTESAGEQRADTLVLLEVFGRLAYPRLDVAAIIGRAKMLQSHFINEQVAEARLATQREAILEVLDARFQQLPRAELQAALAAIDNVTVLGRLLRLSGTCASVEAFQSGIPANPPRRRRRST